MLKCFSIFLVFVLCEKSVFLSDMLYCTQSSTAVALHCMPVTLFETAVRLDIIQNNDRFC